MPKRRDIGPRSKLALSPARCLALESSIRLLGRMMQQLHSKA